MTTEKPKNLIRVRQFANGDFYALSHFNGFPAIILRYAFSR